ncbi:MAG: colanic acid biosynthesis acetyltransferase WcaF [Ferruginibacter sp.]|nr:colanic acid biosynthesis acetyltransferase WcaF [Ferruginibacter sp.]
MPVDLSSYNNDWYKPGASWKRALWYCMNALFLNTAFFPFGAVKIFLLRSFGAKIGEGLVLKPHVNIKYPWLLVVGDHCWIGEHVWIDNLGLVTLGNNVCLSQGALLLSGNHDFTKTGFDLRVSKIELEDGVWIGAKAVVCGGVIAGSHAVLSVGSVATTSLEPYGIYRGNPAEKVKQRVIQ